MTDHKCNHHHHACKKAHAAETRIFEYPIQRFNEEDTRAIETFRDYLRIKTVHPKPDYAGAMAFLQREADRWGLAFRTLEVVEGKPIAILTWQGTDPSLKSIVLNSHTDVVPVVMEKWNTDPFEAVMDEKQNIYARGTQDMKSVGIQHIEAVGRLKKSGATFRRTIHLLYVPDEEIGGHDGMEKFIKAGHMTELNPALVLDEGLASPSDAYTVFYGERAPWWIRVKSVGSAGHGSRFIENTAMERLIGAINKLLAFRSEQKAELESNPHKRLGDVTTVNLTYLKGGVSGDGGKTYSINVIPTEAEAGFDIRITPHISLEDFEKQLRSWTSDMEGVSLEFIQHTPKNVATSTKEDNPWFGAFKSGVDIGGSPIDLEIFPAATDSRYIRNVMGLPAFGFSPMNRTPILLHDHNEFINASVFVNGIQEFMNIIPKLANADF